MSAARPDVTTLLHQVSQGDLRARDDLFPLVEAELRKRAHAYLRREHADPALETTVLIHDAFLKLTDGRPAHWQDRAQFYALAARCMRQILVDHARSRAAQKNGSAPTPLDQVPEPAARGSLAPSQLMDLHEALERLAVLAPELSQIVELHHFGGWELKQIAVDVLNISYKEAKNRWAMAKAWLYRELHEENRHAL